MNIALHHLYNRASTAAYQLPGLRSLFYIIDLCVNTDKLRIFLNVPKRSTINTFSLFTAFKGNLVLFSFIRKKKKKMNSILLEYTNQWSLQYSALKQEKSKQYLHLRMLLPSNLPAYPGGFFKHPANNILSVQIWSD